MYVSSESICMYVCVSTAPLAGALVNKFGCRPVSMFGAVLSAFGFAISTLSPNIDVMMITYGIIGGTLCVCVCAFICER